eukprot:UN04319
METNWTFRGSGNRLIRKHVIMRVERMPFEKEVESKDYFGKSKSQKGYIWKGFITIHKKRLKKGLTMKDLYDEEGEDYFDGEKAVKSKQNNEEIKGNGAVILDAVDAKECENKKETEIEKKADGNDDDSTQETQVYEVELVINKEDALSKDKELKQKILAAVNHTSSNSPTPR